MSPEAQRIAIARVCPDIFHVGGNALVETPGIYWIKTGEEVDPLNDLNAMFEAEKILMGEQYSIGASSRPQDHAPLRYYGILLEVVSPDRTPGTSFSPFDYFSMATATTAQRAEAFLRAIHKWEA